MRNIEGIIPALITPYDANGKVNPVALTDLVNALMADGADGFYVSGSTGEAFLQTVEERKLIIKTVMETVQGKIPVIFQVGALSTDQAVTLAKYGKELGVDAISAVAPIYYPYNKTEIVTYYREIMEASGLPMIIYNIPHLSGVDMAVVGKELFSDPQVYGIKHTTTNLFQLEQLKTTYPALKFYYGFDEQVVGGIAMGADGCIGSTYNFQTPRFKEIRKLMSEGKAIEAMVIQKQANAIIASLLENGLFNGIRHLVFTKYGIDTGVNRKPFLPISDAAKAAIEKAYKNN